MAPEAVEHAYGKCIEALDRIPRPTRLALLQWSLAPALMYTVRTRNMCCLTSEGELDFSGFARTHQLALRVFLCVEALGRIDWTAPNDEAVTAAAALLHYGVSEVVDPSWPINALKFTTAFCRRPRMCEFVTPAAAEHCNAEYAPGIVFELTSQIASVAAVAEIALTAIVLREVAEVAHPGGDFWTRRLVSGSTNGVENRPFPTFAERLDRLIMERALDGFFVSKLATENGVLNIRCVWCGCPFNEAEPMPLAPPLPDEHKSAFVGGAARFFASNCAATIREAAGCADCPAVESVSVVFSGFGRLLRAVAPVATAIFVDMQDDEIREKVVSEDPAFYGEMDRLGIRVYDMNAAEPADDAATAGSDDAGS